MAANIGYVFTVFCKKEIALRSDEIAERVETLISKHFGSHPSDKLDTTQIHRFTGIAYSSDNTKNLQAFIEGQAAKENKAEKGKKPWTTKNLDTHLLAEIRKISKEDSPQVYEEALNKTQESLETEADEFDTKNRKGLISDINIELLKRFATHFGIHYLYEGG